MFIEQQISVLIELRKKKKQLPSNLRNRTGEGRKPQTLCDKRDNNFAWKNIPPNFSFLLTDLFVKDQKTLMSITTKRALNSPTRLSHTSVLPPSSFYSTKNHQTGTGKLFRLISNNTNSELILQSSINNEASYIISWAWKISSKINWNLLTSAVPRLRSGEMLQTFVKWEGASSTSSSHQLHANECKISRFSGANLHSLWTYHL